MSHVHRQDSSRERAPWSRRPSVASTTTAVSSSSEYSSALPLPFCADDESEEKAPTSTSTSPSSIVPPPPDHHHHHHFPARRQDDLEVGSSCSSSSNGSSSSDYHRCSMASSCHVVARDLPYVSHTTSLLPSTPNRTHPATPLPQDPLLAQSSQLQQQQWEGGAGGAAAVVMISSLPNSSLLSLPSRPYLMGLGNDHKPFNGSHKAKQSPEKEEKEEDGEKESTNLVATVGNDGPTPVRNEGGGSSSPSSSTSLAVATLRGASRRRSVSIAESAGRGTTTTVPPVPVQSLTLAELDIMSRAALIDHIVALQGCHQNGATCPQPPPPPPVATPCNGIVLPSQLQSQDPSTLPVLIVQQEEEQQPQQQQKQRITLFQPQKQIGLEFDASLTTPTPIPLQSQSQLEGMEAALMDKSTSPATTPPSPASGRGLRLPPTLTMHEFAEKSLLTDFAANLNLTPVASAAWLQPVTTTEHVQKAVDDDGSKLINDYVVLQELGRGAFGKVKLAYDPHHCRMVAIKIVRKPSGAKALRGNQQDEIATLQREIAVMKKLRHKNIVNLYEVIDDPEANKLYLVMRYVDNGPIGKVETDLSSTRYPPEELLPLATNVINGLYYLHARNIVHRDIKPENILVSSDGEAFLADFGVSEMFEREDAMSVEGKRGTKLFMAPELLNSTGNAVKGRALDIWALGVTMFALLTGRMPFSSTEEITDATKPDFSSLPAAWVTMIKGMLHRDAEKRLSVHHLRQHIKRLDPAGGKTPLPDAELLQQSFQQPPTAEDVKVEVSEADLQAALVPKLGSGASSYFESGAQRMSVAYSRNGFSELGGLPVASDANSGEIGEGDGSVNTAVSVPALSGSLLLAPPSTTSAGARTHRSSNVSFAVGSEALMSNSHLGPDGVSTAALVEGEMVHGSFSTTMMPDRLVAAERRRQSSLKSGSESPGDDGRSRRLSARSSISPAQQILMMQQLPPHHQRMPSLGIQGEDNGATMMLLLSFAMDGGQDAEEGDDTNTAVPSISPKGEAHASRTSVLSETKTFRSGPSSSGTSQQQSRFSISSRTTTGGPADDDAMMMLQPLAIATTMVGEPSMMIAQETDTIKTTMDPDHHSTDDDQTTKDDEHQPSSSMSPPCTSHSEGSAAPSPPSPQPAAVGVASHRLSQDRLQQQQQQPSHASLPAPELSIACALEAGLQQQQQQQQVQPDAELAAAAAAAVLSQSSASSEFSAPPLPSHHTSFQHRNNNNGGKTALQYSLSDADLTQTEDPTSNTLPSSYTTSLELCSFARSPDPHVGHGSHTTKQPPAVLRRPSAEVEGTTTARSSSPTHPAHHHTPQNLLLPPSPTKRGLSSSSVRSSSTSAHILQSSGNAELLLEQSSSTATPGSPGRTQRLNSSSLPSNSALSEMQKHHEEGEEERHDEPAKTSSDPNSPPTTTSATTFAKQPQPKLAQSALLEREVYKKDPLFGQLLPNPKHRQYDDEVEGGVIVGDLSATVPNLHSLSPPQPRLPLKPAEGPLVEPAPRRR